MPTLSPTLIGTFVVSIALQVAALSLLPITQGFSRPLPVVYPWLRVETRRRKEKAKRKLKSCHVVK